MVIPRISKVRLGHEESAAVDLGEVPFPILEKIAAKMEPGELHFSVSKVCRQIKEAAYHVIFGEYCSLRQDIKALLGKVKKEAEDTLVSKDNFQDYIVLVTLYGFLQVLDAEYRSVEVILSQEASVVRSPLPFRAINCIHQYCYLLDNYLFFQWSAFTDTNSILKPLSTLNNEIAAEFLMKFWDIKKDPLGLVLLRLLGCSPCSAADLIVSYRTPPDFSNSTCCIQGTYYLPDFSAACPPFAPRREGDFHRELLCYVWRSISWSNAFHVHRLRWKFLEMADNGREEWELLGPGYPYTEESLDMKTKREKPAPGGQRRIWRSVRKVPEDEALCQPFGIRFSLKLQCPLSEVPRELFPPEEYALVTSLPRRFRPARYQFGLDLRGHVLASMHKQRNIVVSSVSLQETAQSFTYSFSKNLLF